MKQVAKCLFTGKQTTLSVFDENTNDNIFNYANVAGAILRLQNGYCEPFDGINADLAISSEALLEVCEFMYEKYKSPHAAFMITQLKNHLKSLQTEDLKPLITSVEGNTFTEYDKDDDLYGLGLEECRFSYGDESITTADDSVDSDSYLNAYLELQILK
jgi:hypothetical protein